MEHPITSLQNMSKGSLNLMPCNLADMVSLHPYIMVVPVFRVYEIWGKQMQKYLPVEQLTSKWPFMHMSVLVFVAI